MDIKQGINVLKPSPVSWIPLQKGHRIFLARYGGEEFAIILPNTPSQGALIIANTIKTEVENAHLVHHKSKISQYITLSLGVATVTPSCNYSPEDLLNSADKALYKAKKKWS